MRRLTHIPYFISRALVGVGAQGLIIAAVSISLLLLLLIPLPTFLLDLLLVTNLCIALALLLAGLYIKEVKQLYTFPAILLLTTLFRLSLNVSSTRLILLNGDTGFDAAGKVIEAFGTFVVQGEFVVGAIIFAIIAIVNFVVIAKGSARVAEVAARFTLDAMPGKQLAIDSDLRAGTISKEEAHLQRTKLSQESQFYGSMDGAMRFVQGDAVAGFVITFINAVGGISIGLSRELSFSDAIDTYGVLTIGDGLISILPSLLVSVCAGIVVTRVAKSKAEIEQQADPFSYINTHPKAISIAGLIIFSLGVVPGFPFMPFAVIGGILLFAGGWAATSSSGEASSIEGLSLAPEGSFLGLPSSLSGKMRAADSSLRAIPKLPAVDSALVQLHLEVDGASLSSYLEQNNSENLREFKKLEEEYRQEIFRSRGVKLPNINVSFSNDLESGTYRIYVREQKLKTKKIATDQLMICANSSQVRLMGIVVERNDIHPIEQYSTCWVKSNAIGIDSLSALNVESYEPVKFMLADIVASFFDSIDSLVGLDEVKSLVERIKQSNSSLYAEVFDGGIISFPELAQVFKRLIRERVSVRDVKLILESVAEFHSQFGDIEDRQIWLTDLHSFIRKKLSHSIVKNAQQLGGRLRTFALSNELEEEFRSVLNQKDRTTNRVPLAPYVENAVRRSAQNLFSPVLERGVSPVVLVCSADILPAVDAFFAQQLQTSQWYRTIAYEEIEGSYNLESVGVIGLGHQ